MSSQKSLIVSLHDAHPGSWTDISEQLNFLSELDVNRCSILLVPEFHHDRRIGGWTDKIAAALHTRQEAGYDLVLHGYYHDRAGQPDTFRNVFWTRLYTNHEAEFLDLPDSEAQRRIERGLELFREKSWQANGFIAPAWLMSPTLTALLRRNGFRYTNRLTEILPFGETDAASAPIPSQSLCYSTRAAWRRFASLRWNAYLFSKLRQTNLMRLSLHPHDLHFAPIRQQIAGFVKTALHEGFEPTTYAKYVAR